MQSYEPDVGVGSSGASFPNTRLSFLVVVPQRGAGGWTEAEINPQPAASVC